MCVYAYMCVYLYICIYVYIYIYIYVHRLACMHNDVQTYEHIVFICTATENIDVNMLNAALLSFPHQALQLHAAKQLEHEFLESAVMRACTQEQKTLIFSAGGWRENHRKTMGK